MGGRTLLLKNFSGGKKTNEIYRESLRSSLLYDDGVKNTHACMHAPSSLSLD